MATHAGRRISDRRPDLNRRLRRAWPQLPEAHRRTATNLSSIRLGTACLAFLIVAGLGNAVATKTPAEFAAWILSFNPILAVASLAAIMAILAWRSVATAPRFMEAYREILPDDADEIDAAFGERGIGDVIAPWIRGPEGRWTRIARRLAGRFRLLP